MSGPKITSSETASDVAERRKRCCLVLALEGQHPAAGGQVLGLTGVNEIEVRRGDAREVRPEAGVVGLPDGRLSSRHARFLHDSRGWWVEDLDSKNGTRVMGEPVQRRLLRDGDVVEMGSSYFVFRSELELGVRPPTNPAPAHEHLRTLRVDVAARFGELARVAPSMQSVLVRGETGTGKELSARAIHELSGRTGAFVAVNCGALPESLLEAELFGARRGAYSGAAEDRHGLVRTAHGGTLFLDEIAELSETSQVALLRVLQEGEVTPVGASTPVPVDVRFVAATHQNLEERIESGRFRRDLYSRLTGFITHLPPLRERKEDMGLLSAAILRRAAPDRAARLRFRKSAARAIMRYHWPSNIRELANALQSALLLAEGDDIALHHLPEALAEAAPATSTSELDITDPIALERRLIELYKEHGGNISAVARELGKARSQVQRWNKRFGIDTREFAK